MGFFSWKCCVCGESIPAYPYAGYPKERSHIVLVLPDKVIAGIYDGYGIIHPDDGGEEVDVYDAIAPYYFKKPATRDNIFGNKKYLTSPEGVKHIIDKFHYGEPTEIEGKTMNQLTAEGWKITSDFYLSQEFIKIVRFDKYVGQEFNELKPSEDCPDQGYFYEAE